MEKHMALYHTAGKKEDLGNIDNPFEPKLPNIPDQGNGNNNGGNNSGNNNTCPTQSGFLEEINKIFKLN